MPKQTFFNLPEEKKQNIINDAAEILSREPIQNISTNKLIEEIEIPTGSFYQYFKNKEDLYFYMLSYYMDNLLEESERKNLKIDLFDKEKSQKGSTIFNETREKVKYYREICIENFNKAPIEIKRKWTFQKIINGKYFDLYDSSFLDQDNVDSKVKENKDLIMGLTMVVPTVLQCFIDRNTQPETYQNLYAFCINLIKSGVLNFHEYNNDIQN